MKTTFCTCAFLSNCNHEHPTLEIKEAIPKYTKITITTYTFGELVTPAGFDKDGNPYFSDEFYQNLRNEYDEIIKYDKERARNLFWFDIAFELLPSKKE